MVFLLLAHLKKMIEQIGLKKSACGEPPFVLIHLPCFFRVSSRSDKRLRLCYMRLSVILSCLKNTWIFPVFVAANLSESLIGQQMIY